MNAVFTVSLSSASGQAVRSTTRLPTARRSPARTTSPLQDNLVFNPGQTTRTITVTVSGDALDEIDETFTLALTNASNATIADNLGLGTITRQRPAARR